VRAIRIAIGVAGLATAVTLAVVPAGAAVPQSVGPAGVESQSSAAGPPTEYVVLYRDARHAADARSAIRAAGGSVVSENTAIGSALVRTSRADFTSVVRRSRAITGSTHNRPIGRTPTPARSLVERLAPADRAAALRGVPVAAARPAGDGDVGPTEEPLASLQWDMKMIGATAAGSYAVAPGDRRVRVGIIDTGVDGTHPDIAPNFDRADSRNFTTDIPDADGPCEVTDCVDPPDVDDNGHGTHVASTIGAPINGIGIAGVAPNVTLVSLRAGQDSGFFFLQPTVDALTYAGDSGIDVVNMSFYVDPWLYNCASNPADPPEAQAEQRTVVEAVQRAVTYAIHHGVTPFAALGNESTDLGYPDSDPTSPDYPKAKAYDRVVDNSCLTVPAETVGVESVSALGPSGRKAAYSNYGVEQTDLSAPGGDAFDSPDNKVDPTRMILAAYPENVARAEGSLDANGEPETPFVVKNCREDVCAYYQYLQGTSMAAPHAAGVAALAVSRFGRLGGTAPGGNPSVTSDADGLTLEPYLTTLALWASAVQRPCPSPPAYTYTVDGANGRQSFTHNCEQALGRNGFYGHGMVSASGVAALPALGTMPATAPAPARP
jgi:subtilisin family serine protease